MRKSKNLIDSIIQQVEHLPTIPPIVIRVLAMAESPHINAVELSRVMDQSLAAKVLRVANSAYYGGRVCRNVTSLPHAIVLIGFDAVKEIILTTSFFHTLHDAQDILSIQPLWKHSLECALVSKRLAWIYRYPSLDEAYFSGLIHDIGKLIIHQYFPDQQQEIENRKKTIGTLEAEKEILGLTHAEVGAKVANYWHFPETILEVILHHHDQKWQQNAKLGKIIHFSDLFVQGRIDFSSMLKTLSEEGMPYPAIWDSSDLQEVDRIIREELNKALSMFNSTMTLTRQELLVNPIAQNQ